MAAVTTLTGKGKHETMLEQHRRHWPAAKRNAFDSFLWIHPSARGENFGKKINCADAVRYKQNTTLESWSRHGCVKKGVPKLYCI